MQLVAYGAQDTYLTGNPQITFFKVVYKRHTNFAMESISQTMNGTIGLGNTFSCILGRNGDLVHRVYLEMTFNQDISNAWRVGHQVIDNIEIEIGGQVVDRHYGEWMDIWTQLSHTEANWQKLDRMIGGSLKDSNNPNYWIHIFIIGILWEIIETSVKNKPFYIGKCNVNISTDELNGWWYGRYEDIIMNSFGQLFGYWIANKGITSLIFIPLYIIVILFQIYMIK